MPELPEVEVTRRTIAPGIEGARIRDVRLGKPLRWPLGCAPNELAGRVVTDVTRRGKYLWLALGAPPVAPVVPVVPVAQTAQTALDARAAAGGLLIHLGMSGSLAFARDLPPAGVHDHVDIETDRGTLRLHDPRRFGAVIWSASLQAEPAAARLRGLGPEPFDPALTPERFHDALRGRRLAIKPLLLAGDVVVGAGNIYACEALFQAGVHPAMPAGRLSRPRAARLLQALRQTLQRALALGGSTLRDFRDAHGMDGAFQHEAAVYGRAGLPCGVCGTPIRRLVQGQRSTFYCPRCQRR